MRYGLAVALLSAAAMSRPALAQHDAAELPAQAAEGCALCHATHRAAPGPYSLKAGDVGPGWGRLAAVALGSVSQSCLRCHETPEVRARQPEYAQHAAFPIQGGRYLGSDPASGHVLGRVDPASIASPTWRVADARSDRRPTSMNLLPRGDDASVLTCTTCHDPHRRDTSLPPADQQHKLCGSCHDPASYEAEDHAVLSCSACHTIHGAHGTALISARSADELCRSCHDPAMTLLGEPPERLPAATTAGHVRSAAGSCRSCHAAHR